MSLDLMTLSGSLAFAGLLISLAILMMAQGIGTRLRVMDHPDAVRKRHAAVTPLVGGLAIMVPFCLWCFVMLITGGGGNAPLLSAVLLCGAGATLVGFADDQSPTSPSSRLLSLILFCVIALTIDPHLIPTRLNWGSFSPSTLPAWGGGVFVAIAMTGFVNAVNMADGQNGIVLGMYVIWAICLIVVGHGADANVAQILFGTTLVVLFFNLGGKVFLGDAGTYGVTFVFGLLAIVAHNRWGVTAETIAVWFFIPVVDCVRLMVSRATRGQALSQPDRDHFHHRLEDKLGRNLGLCIYLGMVALSSLVSAMAPQLALVCMLVLTAFYFSFAWLTEARDAEDELFDDIKISTPNVVKLEPKDSVAGGR